MEFFKKKKSLNNNKKVLEIIISKVTQRQNSLNNIYYRI